MPTKPVANISLDEIRSWYVTLDKLIAVLFPRETIEDPDFEKIENNGWVVLKPGDLEMPYTWRHISSSMSLYNAAENCDEIILHPEILLGNSQITGNLKSAARRLLFPELYREGAFKYAIWCGSHFGTEIWDSIKYQIATLENYHRFNDSVKKMRGLMGRLASGKSISNTELNELKSYLGLCGLSESYQDRILSMRSPDIAYYYEMADWSGFHDIADAMHSHVGNKEILPVGFEFHGPEIYFLFSLKKFQNKEDVWERDPKYIIGYYKGCPIRDLVRIISPAEHQNTVCALSEQAGINVDVTTWEHLNQYEGGSIVAPLQYKGRRRFMTPDLLRTEEMEITAGFRNIY